MLIVVLYATIIKKKKWFYVFNSHKNVLEEHLTWVQVLNSELLEKSFHLCFTLKEPGLSSLLLFIAILLFSGYEILSPEGAAVAAADEGHNRTKVVLVPGLVLDPEPLLLVDISI